MSKGTDFSRVSPQLSAVCKASRRTFLRCFETAFIEGYAGDIVRAAAEDDDANAGATVVTYGVDRQTMFSNRGNQFDYILTIRVVDLPQGYCKMCASILWASLAFKDLSSNPHGRIFDLIAALVADFNDRSDDERPSDASGADSTADKAALPESAQGDKHKREAPCEGEHATKEGALPARTYAVLKRNNRMRALPLVITIVIAIACILVCCALWQPQGQGTGQGARQEQQQNERSMQYTHKAPPPEPPSSHTPTLQSPNVTTGRS